VRWRKSSYSSDSANCVEVAEADDILVRDSKDPDGPRLRFSRETWAAFINGVKTGEFSDPQ